MQILIISHQPALVAELSTICLQAGHIPLVATRSELGNLGDHAEVSIVLLDQDIDDFNDLCLTLLQSPLNTHCQLILLLSDPQAAALQPLLGQYPFDFMPLPLTSPALLLHKLHLAQRHQQQPRSHSAVSQQLRDTRRQLEHSRENLQTILNHLRVGTAITEPNGTLAFLSEEALRIFELDPGGYRNKPWEDIFPFKPDDLLLLAQAVNTAAEAREKLQFHLRTPGGSYYWIDVEVLDAPQHHDRKLFFFYDMSEMYGLRRMLDEKAQFHDLIGKSKAMRLVYQGIQEVAGVDMTVLIEGETGTGKELVARAIHSSSHRKDKPFIGVNCAGLTDSLLTSQLFGHKRGAFTGAIEDHKGVFEAADGGTLFLDEIGDIPGHVQTALLRVLQEREVTRLGDSTPRHINVRVIAATNRNLLDEVKLGNFRADLYYRIRVARINTPSLQERREDIPLLVGSMLTKNRAATGKNVTAVSDRAMRQLMTYTWPGNVRELVNAIEFSVMRARDHTIQAHDLPPELLEFKQTTHHTGTTAPGSPKECLLDAIEKCQGNRKKAAQLLGMSRATLYRQLSKYGILDSLSHHETDET